MLNNPSPPPARPTRQHDADWNPHADSQAVDRAHRLGQTRPVAVYRLVGADTLDEQIARIAAQKLALDRALKGSSSGDAADGSGFVATEKKSRAEEMKAIKEALELAIME